MSNIISFIFISQFTSATTDSILLLWVAWPSHKYLMSNAADLLCQNGHVVSSLYIEDRNYPFTSLSNRSNVCCNGGSDMRVDIDYPNNQKQGKTLYDHIWNNPALLTLDFPNACNFFIEGCAAVANRGYFEKLKALDFDVVGVDSYFDECYLYIADYLKKPVIRILYGWTVIHDAIPFGYVPLAYTIHPTNRQVMYPSTLIKRITNVGTGVFVTAMRNVRNLIAIHKTCNKIVNFDRISYQYRQSQRLKLNFMDRIMANAEPTYTNVNNLQNYQVSIHQNEQSTLLAAHLSEIIEKGHFAIVTFSTGAQHQSYPSSIIDAVSYVVENKPDLTFIMQWGGDQFDNYNRPNLFITDKIPLMAVLGHRNCKMYVTACGMAGIVEAVHNEVPVVCVPNFLDHHQNAYFVGKNSLGVYDTERPLKRDAFLKMVDLVDNNRRLKSSLHKFNLMLRSFEPNAKHMLNHIVKTAAKPDISKFLYSRHSVDEMTDAMSRWSMTRHLEDDRCFVWDKLLVPQGKQTTAKINPGVV